MNVQKATTKGEREVNYRNQSDETLVLMTLAGEKEAFEELVIRHRNTVIAAAASVTHNHFMAEDASQDAFVAVRESNLIASRRLLFAYFGVLLLARLIPCFAKSHQNPSKINSP